MPQSTLEVQMHTVRRYLRCKTPRIILIVWLKSDWVVENKIKRFLFTTMVTTTSVMLYGAVSWNADMSVMFTPSPGVHSPTFANACCLSFIKSNLKSVLRPSLNCIGPVSPLTSTCVSIKTIRQCTSTKVFYRYWCNFHGGFLFYIVAVNVFIFKITVKSSIDGQGGRVT